MTRTFSFGRPNICASTRPEVDDALRRVVERQMSIRPRSQSSRAARCGLCVSAGVTYVWSSLTGAAVNAASASPRSLCRRLRGPNVVTTISGSSSAFRSRLDVRLLLGVVDAHGIGGRFGRFERVGHGQRDVLAVVANRHRLQTAGGVRRMMPWKPAPRTERKIFPMFSRWKIARTPGIFSASAVSSLTMRPLAIVASTGTA